ncbi:hypothetical protein PV08_05202 [Exophiala spinifera]|uniref:Uncharacterized protein n=1 Tax=Exophiala spinifera TaxID=91928 RepID=A0A0D1ZQT1_9EURO|nr:uncharacterized protein PV08_05202 [Exophiala spinifera]KIW15157.1 hypothetical protein PV08_05202 [Exophiala spinifera]
MSELDLESQPTKTINVKLSKTSDWDNWFIVIELYARQRQIWQYIDPDVQHPPTLLCPRMPDLEDIKPGATLLSELTPTEQDDLRYN